MHLIETPPLSLYIHLPWCVKKCPYCDFNSYQIGSANFPEDTYIDSLISDLEQDLAKVWGRKIISIFIGGGTPSLFSAAALEKLLQAIQARLAYNPEIEITLEANPGTFEQQKFKDFRQAGINRLSIGIQSFQTEKLAQLGRIHNGEEAKRAVDIAYQAGFTNINLDLMHGLPQQSVADALSDLTTAINFAPQHLSWYQLTLEPNTLFAKFPPQLPGEDNLLTIQEEGHNLLAEHNYQHYEISAYCQPEHQSIHNLNYWRFGDYLGIGAGAHSKLTDLQTQTITRYAKTRNPNDYLNKNKPFICQEKQLNPQELPLEFMMNALRLTDGVEIELFSKHTGLKISTINDQLLAARQAGFLENNNLKTTALGQQFLNDCLLLFDQVE